MNTEKRLQKPRVGDVVCELKGVCIKRGIYLRITDDNLIIVQGFKNAVVTTLFQSSTEC